MNCNTVRELLAVIRPDSRDAEQPELASEMMHLEQCAECRAFFEAQQRADRELSRAVRGVAIPVDLKSRLLAQLNAAIPVNAPTTTAAATEPAVRPRSANRSWNRRQLVTIAGALLVAVIGGWWFLHTNRKPIRSVDELVALCHAPFAANSPAFEKSFRLQLPQSEIRISAPPAGVKSLRFQEREIGAVIFYPIRLAASRNSVDVMLVVIDLKKVQVPNLNGIPTSFLAASVYYPPPHSYATRVWQVGHNLYVCYARSHDPQVLGRLKNQSATT